MTSLGFRPKQMFIKDFIAWHKVTKKLNRKRNNNRTIKLKKHIKKILKAWQKTHLGRLPNLSVIPKGSYCDECPYYYIINIYEDDKHVGYVAHNQTYIGGCRLINKTDDDLHGYGMLFDGIKECPF